MFRVDSPRGLGVRAESAGWRPKSPRAPKDETTRVSFSPGPAPREEKPASRGAKQSAATKKAKNYRTNRKTDIASSF